MADEDLPKRDISGAFCANDPKLRTECAQFPEAAAFCRVLIVFAISACFRDLRPLRGVVRSSGKTKTKAVQDCTMSRTEHERDRPMRNLITREATTSSHGPLLEDDSLLC